MEKITNSIPELFYDLIGIFIPGLYLYFSFLLIYDQKAISQLLNKSFLNEAVFTILLIYISGHIVYTFSSYAVAKSFNRFGGNPITTLLGSPKSEKNKKFDRIIFIGVADDKDGYFKRNVEKGIRALTNDNTFSLTKEDGSANIDNILIAFEFCRNYIMEKTISRSGTIRKEQSYGEMSRGIILVAFIGIVWICIKQISGNYVNHFWYLLMFFVLSFIAFTFRYVQVRRINPFFIYSTFCFLINDKQTEKNNNNEK